MENLHGTEVRRAGETEHLVRVVEGSSVKAYVPQDGEDIKGFRLECVIPSKGGGNTRVQLFVPVTDFAQIASLMANVSPRRALEAFSKGIEVASKTLK